MSKGIEQNSVHCPASRPGACDPTSNQPPGEELREVGPSFISIYDAEWNEIDTFQLNNDEPAFRVMVDSEGDDINVAYDEVDRYAWQDVSIAKLEHFRIIAAR
ncbi:MAG: hypothetical protein QF724_02695 [Planctomycetota bacterium]|nr:hypothetical protein [Planctomycetota bacterium]